MHVGERPYVVAGTGTINISTHPLTIEMMTGMLAQLLSAEGLVSLEEYVAARYGELGEAQTLPLTGELQYTAGFNVNGMRNQSNNFLMDGATNNDTFNTGFVLRPPPDAIQEFKILTHSYGAEYGRSAGAASASSASSR
jgi:hypothetical protein